MQTRNTQRKIISLPGRYFTGHGTAHDVMLADISPSGCRFHSDNRRLAVGGRVQIYVESWGPFHAIIKWLRDGEVGVRFTAPIEPANFARFQNSHIKVGSPGPDENAFDAVPVSPPARFC